MSDSGLESGLSLTSLGVSESADDADDADDADADDADDADDTSFI